MRALLHGFTGSPESWSGFDGTALEIYGHRGVAEEPSTWERELERLASQITAPCTVAGYSMGARLALGLVVEYPHLFDRVVLIGGTAGLSDTAARIEQDAVWSSLLEQEGIEAFADRWEQQPILRTVSNLPAARRDRPIRRSHSAHGLAAALRVLGTGAMPSYWDALPAIEQPVALIVGGEDSKFRALAERMLALLPNAELAVIPGCGHNVLLERPDVVRSYIS